MSAVEGVVGESGEPASGVRWGSGSGDGSIRRHAGWLEGLLEHSVDTITLTEIGSRRLLEVSSSFCALTGYSREELIGRTAIEVGLVSDEERRARATADTERGLGGVFESRIRCKDGTHRALEISIQLLEGDEVALTIGRDVTERGRAERELARQHARFRAAVESSLDVFWIVSPVRDERGEIIDFRSEYVNDAACAMVGLDRDQLLGQNIGELVPGFSGTERFALYRQAVLTGESGRTEDVVRYLPGSGASTDARFLDLSVVVLDSEVVVAARDVTERRVFEAQLRASEERFHIAVESIPDAFAILSPVRDARGEIIDFRYEYANDATCALLELEREQLLGHTVCELFSWFRDSERFALYRRAALTREPVVSNYVPGQSALAGSRFTDSALNTVIVSMGENIVLLSRDVTDHWNTERELELRAELLDLAHDAVIVREPSESRVRFWNREAQSVYGYSAQEAIGRVTHELLATVFPESREAADEALARDGHWDGELRHRRKDGSEILVSSRQAMQNDPDGHPLAIIELNSDITAQRQAEHDLLDSRAQLAEAERIARIGSWQWNLTDDHIICSAGLLEIYGLTPDEFAAGFQGINQRVYPDDRELVSRALERAIDERSSFTADYRVIRSDGRVRTVRSHGEIVVDETGQPSRAIGIVQDITEAKLAHEALRSTSVDLERRAAELQQIALSTAQEPPAAAHAPLTARQSEILQLIAQGLTNAAIAERLVLTEGTVKWHVSQILTKTNTSNRVEAIARVLGMRP